MKSENLPLKDACVIIPELLCDNRGAFGRIFCKNEFKKLGHNKEIVQINHSLNRKIGATRGMHFQYPPKCEIKMVKCVKGSVFDVIVDIRKDSPTFLQWHGIELSETNMKMIYIPEGFAHGFQVLQPDSELIYLHTEFYAPEYEGALRYSDPILNIKWPLKVADISENDKNHPLIDINFKGLVI
ncbi:dTDP-4-dehydrorhamnose 3,5-epimerase [Thermodesulfobacteriota bacterium]